MADKLTKFTEQELRQRKIGTFIDPAGMDEKVTQLQTKVQTYVTEGVRKPYGSLLRSFSVLLLDASNTSLPEFYDRRTAAKCAQTMIDTYLFRQARGEKCEIPSQVHLYEIEKASDDDGIELYDPALFEGKDSITENEKVRWIFENIRADGVQPSDAPTIGAYSLLMELRGEKQMRQKFYDSSWLKLLAKEDAAKTGKLEDEGKDASELCARLLEALPESEE
jgi:hypothetical protein